jgi:hypothetical protein
MLKIKKEIELTDFWGEGYLGEAFSIFIKTSTII